MIITDRQPTLGELFKSAIRSHGMRAAFPGNRFPSDNCPKVTTESGLNPSWNWRPYKPFIERGTGRALPWLADHGSKAAAPLELEKAREDARTAPTVFWPRWADDELRPWGRARPRSKSRHINQPKPVRYLQWGSAYSRRLPCLGITA